MCLHMLSHLYSGLEWEIVVPFITDHVTEHDSSGCQHKPHLGFQRVPTCWVAANNPAKFVT